MAKIYFKLVIDGKRTIDDVPTKWRETVRKMVDAEPKVTEITEKILEAET